MQISMKDSLQRLRGHIVTVFWVVYILHVNLKQTVLHREFMAKLSNLLMQQTLLAVLFKQITKINLYLQIGQQKIKLKTSGNIDTMLLLIRLTYFCCYAMCMATCLHAGCIRDIHNVHQAKRNRSKTYFQTGNENKLQ